MNIQEVRATTRAANQQNLDRLRQRAAAHQDDNQAKWRALVDKAQAAIREASEAGKSYTEVPVADRHEYRDLAGHFQADGFLCRPDSDGVSHMVCVIRW